MEIPAEVAAQTPPGLSVVMSTEAWGDYEVPGSPFFVLVDGRIRPADRRRGGQPLPPGGRAGPAGRGRCPVVRTSGSRSRAYAEGLDGPARELANDRELMAAGILPGDPSLYPSSLADVYGPDRWPGARAGSRPRPSRHRPRRAG